jgi:hypothetical protein
MGELKLALQAAAAQAETPASPSGSLARRAPRRAVDDELQQAFVAMRLRKSDFIAAKRFASGAHALRAKQRPRNEMRAVLTSLFRSVAERGAAGASGAARAAANECVDACYASDAEELSLAAVEQRYIA